MFNKKLKEKIERLEDRLLAESKNREALERSIADNNNNDEIEEISKQYNEKMDALYSELQALEEKLLAESKNREALENTFVDVNKSIKQKIDVEIDSSDDRHRVEKNRLDKKIDGMVQTIEKSMVDKFKQLELFKASEEIIGTNPFGNAIIQELTRRSFDHKVKEIESERKDIENEKIKIQNKIKELNSVKAIGEKSPIEINEVIKELKEKRHEAARKTESKGDNYYILKESYDLVINFLTKWLKK